ncbi:7810_t:CDS:2, partial [Cetraspora pellucida]
SKSQPIQPIQPDLQSQSRPVTPQNQPTPEPVSYTIQTIPSPTVLPDLTTVLNFLESHLHRDRTTTLTTLRSRFGLLTNDLVNDSVDAMMAVLFPNTSRRSRSSTPTLPENFYFEEIEDWSYSPPHPVEARDTYEAEILKDGLNLPPNYYKDGNFPSVPRRAHNVPASFIKKGRNMSSKQLCEYYAINNEFSKWINDLFRGELHALFIRCRNLDDSKSNAHQNFVPPLLNGGMFFGQGLTNCLRICREEQKARDVQKVWQQFLVNINIPAIREESTITNNFEKLLSDVVRAGLWAINFFQPKDAQAIFFNLNNDLYTVNLNVLTLSG